MNSQLSDMDRTMLRALEGTDMLKAIMRFMDIEREKAKGLVREAKIGCEVYQEDLRYCLGFLEGIENFSRQYSKLLKELP